MHRLIRFLTHFGYKHIVKPIIFRLSPDAVHDGMLKWGSKVGNSKFWMFWLRAACKYENPILETEAMGINFKNPIGLGAGLDKNAAIANCLLNCGFGHSTFGSVTAQICAGNPRPWFYRLEKYYSLTVHVGLANAGVDVIAPKLQAATQNYADEMAIGTSIARTNSLDASGNIQDAIADYVYSAKELAGKTTFMEINISCPNTYNGEPFLEPQNLELLLTELDKIDKKGQPVTLKMPSQLEWREFRELLLVASKHQIDGLTICNLRKNRDNMEIPEFVTGNLSGAPAYKKSNELIKATFREFGERFCIIGLGGVFTAQHAYEKIRCGANLVELVSGLMFQGPQVVSEIKSGLVKLLQNDGFNSISEAVGIDA